MWLGHVTERHSHRGEAMRAEAGVQEDAEMIGAREGTAGKARAEEKYVTCAVCKDENYDGDSSSERKMGT